MENRSVMTGTDGIAQPLRHTLELSSYTTIQGTQFNQGSMHHPQHNGNNKRLKNSHSTSLLLAFGRSTAQTIHHGAAKPRLRQLFRYDNLNILVLIHRPHHSKQAHSSLRQSPASR